MESLLKLPTEVAAAWPDASRFTEWFDQASVAGPNPDLLSKIERKLTDIAKVNEWERQQLELMSFDLLRGCWAASEYEAGGGASADLTKRAVLRQGLQDRQSSLSSSTAQLLAALRRAAVFDPEDDSDPYAWHAGSAESALFHALSHEKLNQLSEELEHVSAVLTNAPMPGQAGTIRDGGLGCLRYGYKKSFPVQLPSRPMPLLPGTPWAPSLHSLSRALLGNPKPYSARGRAPATANMLAFDMTFRLACWCHRSCKPPFQLPAFPPNTPKYYSLVADLVELTFPGAGLTDKSAADKVRELVRPEIHWWPWPAEWEVDLDEPFVGLLWGLAAMQVSSRGNSPEMNSNNPVAG